MSLNLLQPLSLLEFSWSSLWLTGSLCWPLNPFVMTLVVFDSFVTTSYYKIRYSRFILYISSPQPFVPEILESFKERDIQRHKALIATRLISVSSPFQCTKLGNIYRHLKMTYFMNSYLSLNSNLRFQRLDLTSLLYQYLFLSFIGAC